MKVTFPTGHRLPRGNVEVRLVNRSRGVVIAEHVEIASSFWARLKGLIGRPGLPEGSALAIRPCNSVHSCFLTVGLDVGHLDAEGRVVHVLHDLRPWRFGPLVWNSAWVVELPAGTARATGLQIGDQVELVEVGNEAPGPWYA